jgi:RNA recognition motif-containing protein
LDRKGVTRSQTILLVKNIPATAKEQELREIFERYGEVRLMVSPFNTLAIVEYQQASQAAAALRNLAYYKVNYLTPIYLEFAPTGMLQRQVKAEESGDEDGA